MHGILVAGEIDATKIWTGEPDRDAHLRSADFLDVENHPKITFDGRFADRSGGTDFKLKTDLTIRGVTRPIVFVVTYRGQWETPFWVGEENRGTLRRIGFAGKARLDRRDFSVSWQSTCGFAHLRLCPPAALPTCGFAHLRLCLPAARSGAAIPRPTGTRAGTRRRPVTRSLEPGEDWCWCFIDDELFAFELG